ncbi:MAG: hypothetical protein AMJ54_13285 [Deltaproteobacteria bacterium SG8_13]|nr:MAG: hypothetical protein AMJ54_13285 [Deltaproteobacteria bacterium SG8_13]
MKLRHFSRIAVVFVLVAFSATAFAGRVMTVNGTITDDYLLVDDNGQIYTVTESDKGDELLDNVGSRVSVTGDVEDSDDGPVIDVHGFKVISE